MFDANLYRATLHLWVGMGKDKPNAQVQFSVIDAGSPNASQTMVFLHGFGGRAAYWSHQIEHFQDYYRVIVPDLRGHGLSDAPPSGYDIPTLVSDIQAILQAMQVPEQFILVSHSFGGALATELILRNPSRITQWVMIGTPAKFELAAIAKRALTLPVPVLSLLRQWVPRIKLYPPSHVIHEVFHQSLAHWQADTLLPHIQTPTLIIRGERDFLFPKGQFDKVAELMPSAYEIVIPVSAHQVMVERPDAVHRAMDTFFGGIDYKTAHTRKRNRHKTLEQDQPWIKWYDSRTPPQIRLPKGPVNRYLEVAAQRFPKKTAITFYRRKISYKQLNRYANRFAYGLKQQRIHEHDRVLIALPNSPQAVIAYYAALKIGAVAVFADPKDMQVQQIKDRAQQVGAKLLIAPSTHYASLIDVVGDNSCVQKVVFTSYRAFMGPLDWLIFTLTQHYTQGHAVAWKARFKRGRTVRWFDDLLKINVRNLTQETSVNSLALLQYSSSSALQNNPKIAAHTHLSLMYNALQLRHWLPEARPGDERILATMSFSYTHSMLATLNLAPLLGASLVLVPSVEPLRIAKAIKRYEPTVLVAHPDTYHGLAYTQGIRKYNIASVRVCMSVGAPLAIEIQESFEKLTRGRVLDMYALAECGVTHATPLSASRRYGSMGVPLPGTKTKITHLETGKTITDDQVGQLWVGGHHLMAGYWDIQMQTVKDGVIAQEWLNTGDLVWRDDDGFFYFIRRNNDFLTSTEYKKTTEPGMQKIKHQQVTPSNRTSNHGDLPKFESIYPREIEHICYEHPAIAQAYVMQITPYLQNAHEREAIINPYKGNIAIFIVLQKTYQTSHASSEELQQWLLPRLPAGIVISQIFIRSYLPRTPSGWLDHAQLYRDMRANSDDIIELFI